MTHSLNLHRALEIALLFILKKSTKIIDLAIQNSDGNHHSSSACTLSFRVQLPGDLVFMLLAEVQGCLQSMIKKIKMCMAVQLKLSWNVQDFITLSCLDDVVTKMLEFSNQTLNLGHN